MLMALQDAIHERKPFSLRLRQREGERAVDRDGRRITLWRAAATAEDGRAPRDAAAGRRRSPACLCRRAARRRGRAGRAGAKHRCGHRRGLCGHGACVCRRECRAWRMRGMRLAHRLSARAGTVTLADPTVAVATQNFEASNAAVQAARKQVRALAHTRIRGAPLVCDARPDVCAFSRAACRIMRARTPIGDSHPACSHAV